MRFAYADPPYLGCGRLYAKHHPEAAAWDDERTHRELVTRVNDEYPDGWAISMNPGDLRIYLPEAPADARIAAWVKPFASFKPNVNPGYAWEVVLWRGGRKRERYDLTVRDFLAEPIQLRAGLTGAKPPAFNRWVMDLLNYQEGDVLDDLFPGTGGMSLVQAQGLLL